MAKAPDAFRTISEVADWLDTPAHVLRFWESKFTQIKPIKRAGGRRYYRPEDMELLGGIKALLHEKGMTIKGVQKLLREQGARHVAALGPSVESDQRTDQHDTENTVDAVPDVATAEGRAPILPATGPEARPTEPLQGIDFRAALAAIPATVMPSGQPARPRALALLARADRVTARRNADRIRPLMRQLQDLRARMGRD